MSPKMLPRRAASNRPVINPIGHAEERRAVARAVSYPKEHGSTGVSDARNRSANRSHREPGQKPALHINAALIFGRKSSSVLPNPIAQGGEIARVVKNSPAQVLDKLVRPERFELPASWFVARRSIQLSYGRALNEITAIHGGDSNSRGHPRQISKLLISQKFQSPAISLDPPDSALDLAPRLMRPQRI